MRFPAEVKSTGDDSANTAYLADPTPCLSGLGEAAIGHVEHVDVPEVERDLNVDRQIDWN